MAGTQPVDSYGGRDGLELAEEDEVGCWGRCGHVVGDEGR